jgi:stage II sporulation protein D
VNVSVGLMEGRPAVEVELTGGFTDAPGKEYRPGRYTFASEVTLAPSDPGSSAFALDDVTIGIGFHWERKERQVFRGALRIIKREAGLTVINDVPLEEYVTSVISSEMSATCPIELLKAHAVISRSWLAFTKTAGVVRSLKEEFPLQPHEITRWYGREAHPDFDVCADDHCQRYQGITKAFSPAASEAVRATTGEFLRYNGAICDARFSKSCGGITERYSTAWEDEDIPYLESVYDGSPQPRSYSPETWIRSDPPAYCNTHDSQLLSRILPGFDQETRDFYRWRVEYTPDELADLIKSRLGVDLGSIRDLEALARGPSGRIYRLKISGQRDYLVIGKELEIRRALSRTHLYSSAFVTDKESGRLVLRGAGWGHGVGLCQIGAAVMAHEGKTCREILQHYYRGTTVSA